MRPDADPPEGPDFRAWPPPGATLRTWEVVETCRAGSPPSYRVVRVGAGPDAERERGAGDRPEALHLGALTWLLDEHPRSDPEAAGAVRFRLEVARSEMPGGRVGHRYALDGGPLGAPGAEVRRGALWRWVHHLLAPAP